ncbi:MAG: CvpA family protein [Clostridia bacterium]|nr:CvpA family protein [Clostridia bacterium]
MIFDILLGAFILLFLVNGWRHGFIRSFFGLVGVLASVILTKLLYLPFTEYLFKTPIYQTIADAVTKQVDISIPKILPAEFSEALGITDAFADISLNLLSILTYVVLFLLIYLVLSILVRLLDGVFKLPGLKFINRVLGLIFNGLKGIIVCYVLAVVLRLFAPAVVEESHILTGLLATVPGLASMLF